MFQVDVVDNPLTFRHQTRNPTLEKTDSCSKFGTARFPVSWNAWQNVARVKMVKLFSAAEKESEELELLNEPSLE